jgi:hypothetical protein
MRGTHWWTGSLALACILASGLVGCGKAPSPPTAIPEAQRVGAGSKGQTDVLTVRPSPDAVMATPPPGQTEEDSDGLADDVGDPSEASPDESDAEPAPAAAQAGQVFSACYETRVVGCEVVYVRMVKAAPDICVQLVMDNCDENRRQGLPVMVPLSWRLTSSSASTDRGCELRAYDPKSQPVLSASGTVNFAQQGREISALVMDVQLSLDSSSESKLPAQIAVTTPSPIEDIGTCED